MAMKMKDWLLRVSVLAICMSSSADCGERPNVLFIALDDLNDWIGCMGGHPQSVTPNLNRLASSSVLFTNAHCPAPACNPSRTAIMTGRSPHRSGLYDNGQTMRDVLPDAEIMPKVFSRHGYRSSGSGKLLHYFIDAASWDEYFPEARSENPFPRTMYPDQRPLSLPRAGPWQYVETDWGPLEATDEQYGGDHLVAKWISEQLLANHSQPFYLACGLYRPHEPWFVPAKYFEPFPLNTIQLPAGYRENDLDDLPPEGKRRGPNRYFEHIQKNDQWKQAIQGYLASIHFADAMLGQVLDALESGPNANNTIVVVWSDHGWHLGEKQHWQKYTGWRVCTRVPLMIRLPETLRAARPELGDPAGRVCDRPVSLVSLFPTLLELCGLPAESCHDGPSLTPLLLDTEANWPHHAVTFLSDPGSYAVSGQRWRLIHYANGDEELYDIGTDPFEWNNLATDNRQNTVRDRLRSAAPDTFAPRPQSRVESLPKLAWVSESDKAASASNPDGQPFPVYFINNSTAPVKLFWMDRDGKPKLYATIDKGQQQKQQTRPGAVWLITDEQDKPLGHFDIGDRSSRAVIPMINSAED